MHTVFKSFFLGAAIAAGSLTMSMPANSADFNFDRGHSQIRFGWDYQGLVILSAGFSDFEGDIKFDPADIAASSVNVTINSESIQTGNEEFNGHLKSDEFFDVAKHPTIAFVSKQVVQTGPESAKIMGDLTIKGITKPVILDATMNYSGPHPSKEYPTAGFSVSTEVLRSDFGLGAYGPAISDSVRISISSLLQPKES